jgi:AcrR family transcriptional regulator
VSVPESQTKGELTRQAILARAFELSSRVGLDGLSIGQLAAALGMSKSGLFAHFQSKEALELAVIDFAAERFLEHVIRPALKAPRGEPRLRRLCELWLSWQQNELEDGGCFLSAAAFELDDQPGPVRTRLAAVWRDFIELLENVIRTGVAEGQFRADLDVRQVAHALHGVLLATHHYQRLLGDPDASALAERSIARLVESCRRVL